MSKKRKFIRIKAVSEQTGLSSTGIYERIEEGTFPRQIKLGRISVWDESDIQEWILEKIRLSKSSANAQVV